MSTNRKKCFLADRKIGFQAGLDEAEMDNGQTPGWQREWADAQE
jgi:hypothetical protein